MTEFINGILAIVGIEDEPTYTRSLIVNQQEMIQNLVASAEYLSSDYITRKVLEILGDIDKADEVMEQKLVDETSRYRNEPEEEDTEGAENES